MRRIFALMFLLLASPLYAGIITYDATATATRDWLNGALNTAYNVINGGLDTDNLTTGAICSDDIATSVNPQTRENELIGEYAFSGLTIATSATLDSTITAGVAYVSNDGDGTLHRVVTIATAKTFTASKDTYVYLAYTRAFSYNEQANGASQPSTPTNVMLIAKVVTDGSAVTSVVDLASRTPTNLRIYLDYKQGCIISRDLTSATTVNISRGDIEFGTGGKNRRNTTATTVDFSGNGRGGLDAGSLTAEQTYFIWAVSDDASSTAFDCIGSLSCSDVSSVADERLIGWCYAPTASAISPDSVGAYRGRGGDAPNIVARRGYTDYSLTGNTMTSLPDTDLRFYASGLRPVKVSFNSPVYAAAGVHAHLQITRDGIAIASSDVAQGAGYEDNINILGLIKPSSADVATFQVQGMVGAGETLHFHNDLHGPRILVVEEY